MKAHRTALVAVCFLAALAFAAPAAVAGGRPFTTELTGEVEIPVGDSDGTGTASFTLNPGLGQVCFDIHVENITLPATGAHIHSAPAGLAGPIVIGLTAPDASGDASGCVSADRGLVKAIVLAPSVFYMNVHNVDFPAGAVRGQLG
jgi:hypothetical protein